PPIPPIPPIPPDDDRDKAKSGLGLNSVSEPVQSSAPATSAAMPVSEQEVILSSINRIRLRAGRTSWGPRSVRSFVFRYTLARHLLIRMEIPFEPWELIDALLAAESREDIVSDAGKTGVLQQIARQVS
ncbi:MAG TPA: hypothetical protein DCX79_21180, partial [Planctomycetaceae bacterium]|nr:hypothetical protein [Planctomycetaceae bacterium]